MDINTFIELGQDIEQNPKDALTPDDVAPPLNSDVDYDPSQDPEQKALSLESTPDVPHGAMKEATLIKKKLMEASGINAALYKFWPTTNDHSFENFQASGANTPGVGEKEYKAAAKYLMKAGKLADDPTFAAGGLNAKGNAYGKGGKNEVTGPYGLSDTENVDPASWSKELQQLSKAYGEANLRSESGTADEAFERIEDICYSVAAGQAPMRHAIIYGDPGSGKTYTVKIGVQAGIKENPRKAKLMIKSGSIGSSAGALIGTLYAYRNNWVLVMDDNDAFLTSPNPVVQLMLKGVLDPDTKEVDIPPTQRKLAGRFAAAEAGRFTEGTRIEIDKERLREGILSVVVDGELQETMVSREESADLLALFETETIKKRTQSKLSERAKKQRSLLGLGYRLTEDEDENEEGDEDEWSSDESVGEEGDDELLDNDGDKDDELPMSFTFDSSLIIVSNLREHQIDSAVLSRCVPFELDLTLDEFMDRLAKIYGKLAPLPQYASLSPQMYDWCKQTAYVSLGMVVASFLSGVKLFGVPVVINKKLQFRDLQKLAGDFSILANGYARRNNLKLADKTTRDKVSKEVMGTYYRGIVNYLSKTERTPKV